jgi:hypothetical protein
MAKDAAIFNTGKVQGQVRYPPWESYDKTTSIELQKFSVFPIGLISKYHRHIPYNSEKKSFLEKTGRGAFEGKQRPRTRNRHAKPPDQYSNTPFDVHRRKKYTPSCGTITLAW